MFDKLKNNKKLFIRILVVISIYSLAWIIFQNYKIKKPEVLPTPLPIKFEYLKSIPASGTISTIPITSVIEFYFSRPVDENTAEVTVTPDTQLSFSSDVPYKAFYIKAIPSWKMDQEYKITVKIKSKEGQDLQNTINYSFKLEQMKDSLLTE